jgi:hypothetical protein
MGLTGYSVAADAGRDHLSSEPCRNAQRELSTEACLKAKNHFSDITWLSPATANN